MLKQWQIPNQDYNLGEGAFGKVFKAVNVKDPSFEIAIKKIRKVGLHPECLRNLKREVSIMQQVDHPNIVKYYESYED